MKRYAKVINQETKLCDVACGTDTEYYKSIGMSEQEVEQAYNGQWYIKGYAPEKSDSIKATEIRLLRDKYLKEYIDPMQLIIRWDTLTSEEQAYYKAYRQYLLNIPQEETFPNNQVLTYTQWREETKDV